MGRGYGTEKIEDQIAEIFPEARISRMDLDTTRTRNAYERLISDFSTGKTNLLIGTQMISIRACLYDDVAGEWTSGKKRKKRTRFPSDKKSHFAYHRTSGEQRL